MINSHVLLFTIINSKNLNFYDIVISLIFISRIVNFYIIDITILNLTSNYCLKMTQKMQHLEVANFLLFECFEF